MMSKICELCPLVPYPSYTQYNEFRLFGWLETAYHFSLKCLRIRFRLQWKYFEVWELSEVSGFFKNFETLLGTFILEP